MPLGPTRAEKEHAEALATAVASIILNVVLLIAGIYLIGSVLGWQVGVGIGCLFLFLKGGK